MLVIKVDDDEEEFSNRLKETINIKLQQNDKLKEENARLKNNINKKNRTIKQSRKENLYLQRKIRQLLLKQNLDKKYCYCGSITDWDWDDIEYKNYKWCKWCQKTNHNTNNCWFAPKFPEIMGYGPKLPEVMSQE
ncbi:27522_t:CDS:2 [Racocetra persica]|uniref:27522_t:CDS:1 n=1 Tax=Racocetra persica TaxID=160502 RepID=A0ACA9LY66_9GLOM|nr:27522_t:CDS:2 [Racocetra persica]